MYWGSGRTLGTQGPEGYREHQRTPRGVGAILGGQGVSGTLVTQGQKGYRHQGAPRGVGTIWGCQGSLGGVGVYWGLAGTLGTQGPEGV